MYDKSYMLIESKTLCPILRYSNKAKHLQLKLSNKGLEVIIPAKQRISEQFIEQFIHHHSPWIEKNKHRYLQSQPPVISKILPTTIDLQAVQQNWEVVYLPSHRNNIKLIINATNQLTLLGKIDDQDLCFKMLLDWLKQQAERHLLPELEKISQTTGLTYKKMSIRNNTTRWGSCNSRQHISLCCKLLFLPPLLMQHILIHELCHTKFLNHGISFWRLLTHFDPQAREHARLLTKANQTIPAWV